SLAGAIIAKRDSSFPRNDKFRSWEQIPEEPKNCSLIMHLLFIDKRFWNEYSREIHRSKQGEQPDTDAM
ncbi:MAG: hypothetical protein ACPGWR_23815, partial [Ardenticatenaceae bacterium]